MDKTPAEMLEFAGSKPARAAQQFLANRYPTVAWTATSFIGTPPEVASATYLDDGGNTLVLLFQQRGIAWLISEKAPD
ncbi:hypothetical protein P6166_04240 [Stenotrophomonas sp. HITSZ_GD]|nr:hypothetical protein [Stenotrophomonas sp. HITSZ_GD]